MVNPMQATLTNIETVEFSVRNLDLHYTDKHALKDISIDIYNRRVTALIGPSGCGKSTFLRTLNRMNDTIKGVRTTGNVLFKDDPVLGADVDVVELRKRVGMVFQRPNPFPASIYNNVVFGPKLHGMVSGREALDETVETSLRRAGLWDEVKDNLHKSAFDLSGGQQQRLCIARLLAVQPEVLLMDEPCSALDPIATLKIEELMKSLKEHYTIIVVTHNMQQAARVSDRTAFFLHGEIIEYGPTEKLFTNPEDRRTQDYITGRFG